MVRAAPGRRVTARLQPSVGVGGYNFNISILERT